MTNFDHNDQKILHVVSTQSNDSETMLRAVCLNAEFIAFLKWNFCFYNEWIAALSSKNDALKRPLCWLNLVISSRFYLLWIAMHDTNYSKSPV